MSARLQYCSTAKILVGSLAGSLVNNGSDYILTFLAAKTLVPQDPAPHYKAPLIVATVLAAFAVKATPTDTIVFYTIAWVSWCSSVSDKFYCCMEKANNADSNSTKYANPVLVDASGGYSVIFFLLY